MMDLHLVEFHWQLDKKKKLQTSQSSFVTSSSVKILGKSTCTGGLIIEEVFDGAPFTCHA